MNKNYLILIVAMILIIVSISGYYITANGSLVGNGNVTITDMANRSVTVPANVNKVLTTDPTATVMAYMISPDKLLGFNYQTTSEEQKYMPDKYKSLPSVGGWYGAQTGSYEQFIAMEPDIIFEGVTPDTVSEHSSTLSTITERQQKMGSIPVVGVLDTSNFTSFDPSIKFMGKIMVSEDKAAKLVVYNDKVQKEVKDVVSNIPDSDKVTVYYAEDVDGLKTEPPGSVHAQLIDFCGGKNVADVQQSGGNGETDVTMEQVLKWNPEVIITTDPTFFQNVYNNSQWGGISAVQNRRVYLSPQSPFKWFDRPTGANIIVGIPWVAKILYPDKFKDLNLTSEVKEFYSEFYSYNLTDDEVKNILVGSGLNTT